MSPYRLPCSLLNLFHSVRPIGLLTLALLIAAATGACGEPKPTFDPAMEAATAIDWNILFKGFNENQTRERDELLGAGPVRIAGYLVPLGEPRLDQSDQTEFLLVPYVGACMHLPPPPPDQMIHVQMAPGQAASVNIWSWDPLEVAGVLREETLESVYGAVGYRMNGIIAIREYSSDWGAY